MSDYFERVERQIVRSVQAGAPRRGPRRISLGFLAPATAAALTVAVVAVFLLAHPSGQPGRIGPAGQGPSVGVSFTASSINPRVPLGQAIDASVPILRKRLDSVLHGVRVSRVGDGIAVRVAKAPAGAQKQILALAAPGGLAFYDWEAEAVTPSGKTVASQLRAQNPTALDISQGSGTASPGEAAAGAMSLQQALALVSRLGGGGASASGPGRVESFGGHSYTIPNGFIVLQAISPNGGPAPISRSDPNARFFVLKGQPLLTRSDIVNPRKSTDPTGVPALAFSFTARAARHFQALTATVARRGAVDSGPGQTFNQHFAVAVDNRLISVPFVDFKQYPDGISGRNGADISGGPTPQSVRDLAILVRSEPLAVSLTPAG